MGFRFRVTGVEYDSHGETVLTGTLESGRIGGGDPVRVPTAAGSFASAVGSMEGPGPNPPPYTAEQLAGAVLVVGIEGQPPGRDVIVPCVAEG